ncbi:MAG: 1-(5-phosphoribosyl)-5-[(5-phosphoribosylamino)methylideneamino]imidazole-4-carboxamide isomerase [Sutterellaceae bacterium]|nr:1-(5-phosphoribosyl)-5-[(5-phosphoribosylamino)methylideneamino]imidazole-4-carboxamide isomerase [Sutterellaceae bacterium]MDD7442384.1 1-(5-phosphoribosyl)-5-[(5-phosphoribosylamino)methylideneamino]imidazole-4-carboxamide isomerase [Sutterellaceae bacterium]MDY2867153.1 1-(5-phosphoribosyl)-5-[(5-phosphoribosylamino)methylideneamino]imidazole-4-carboxamide isomerase [Mesosutterella sp.]
MLDLIPAIDIKDGACVRLVQGDLNKNITVYSRDPLEMARRWADLGASRLHLVDLDGAKHGRSVNHDVITGIVKEFSGVMEIDLGGGLRDLDTIESYMEEGLSFAVIGTAAVKQPGFLANACGAFPGSIIVSLDARDGKIATDGWEKTSRIDVIEIAEKFAQLDPAAFLYTDISRDGMLCGVNVEATRRLARATPVPVIASGGVKDMGDIDALVAAEEDGICGVILGKALYEGTLDFSEALDRVSGGAPD